MTGLGAFPFSSRKKPQFINTISRSPSSLWRTTGATWRGKIAFTGSKATVRLCDTRKKRPTWSRFGVSEYRLQIAGLLARLTCPVGGQFYWFERPVQSRPLNEHRQTKTKGKSGFAFGGNENEAPVTLTEIDPFLRCDP